MKTDIQIAQEAELFPVTQVAESAGIPADSLELYGKYKAKLSDEYLESLKSKENGRLILVTAINPTPAGEGKTTTSIGLADAFHQLGKKVVVALREPSLGPCFGVKGGAAGGGYAQAVPMEDLNLHFTGDFHAVTAANNLLAAAIDNHIHHGNALGIDPTQIVWKRCMDMNDRALRSIVVGMGTKMDGPLRQDRFVITAASEIMAILCLANDREDLRVRLDRIVIGYNYQGEPVRAKDLEVTGAMMALLKEAISPNLIQTLEHTPTLVHGGPFANIAHGCNSVRATKAALKIADYTITEAGFGADLGAEKFLDIKCRMAGLHPDAIVIVASVQALKYNGGVAKADLKKENVEALKKGIVNLEKHIENIQKYGKGGIDLAQKVLKTLDEKKSNYAPIYPLEMPLAQKIETVAKEIYGADGVVFTGAAQKQLKNLQAQGFGDLPVCIAKTQYSLSDDQTKLGRPTGYDLNVREVYVSAGAGFVVALTGTIMAMPGLPKRPAACSIDIGEDGKITGLF